MRITSKCAKVKQRFAFCAFTNQTLMGGTGMSHKFYHLMLLCMSPSLFINCVGAVGNGTQKENHGAKVASFVLEASPDRPLFLEQCFDEPRTIDDALCKAMPNDGDCDEISLDIKNETEACAECKRKGSNDRSCVALDDFVELKPFFEKGSHLRALPYRPLYFRDCIDKYGDFALCNAMPNFNDLTAMKLEIYEDNSVCAASPHKSFSETCGGLNEGIPIVCESGPEKGCHRCKDLFGDSVFDTCSREGQCFMMEMGLIALILAPQLIRGGVTGSPTDKTNGKNPPIDSGGNQDQPNPKKGENVIILSQPTGTNYVPSGGESEPFLNDLFKLLTKFGKSFRP